MKLKYIDEYEYDSRCNHKIHANNQQLFLKPHTIFAISQVTTLNFYLN